jgi:hypothetical protein
MKPFSFSITCPHCDTSLRCPPGLVGSEQSCLGCNRSFFITLPVAVPIEHTGSEVYSAFEESPWEFSETTHSMDDSIVRIACVSSEAAPAGVTAQLVCRTTLRKCSVTQEVYVGFAEKVFSVRDDLPAARVRFDENEPKVLRISAAETGKGCFFSDDQVVFTQLEESSHALIELCLMRHGTNVFTFDVGGFSDIRRRMLSGAVEADSRDLRRLNPEIVNHIYRLGPKNVDALIEVLSGDRALSHERFDEARRKGYILFAAAQAFGEKHRVAEIYGSVEGERINPYFWMAVYDHLSEATRAKIGSLTIAQ